MTEFFLLLGGYFAVGNHVFMKYTNNKNNKYFDTQAHMINLTCEGLLASAMANFNYLV